MNVSVLVTEDAEGGYNFIYSSPFSDNRGNLDFTRGAAYGNSVSVTFTIAEGSVPGLEFKSNGADAIWIVDKKNVGPQGSPPGRYSGAIFHDFAVSADGRSLTVVSENNDRTLYRYGLRFDLGEKTVVHDPDIQNDGHG